VEVAHRLWDPVQQYAMIENALRAAEGLTLAEHRAEVAELWARFNRVARTNPDAAFPAPMEAERHRHGLGGQPAAGLPLQQVALHPVDGQPGRRPALCSVETARALGVPSRPVGVPPGRPGVQPRRLAAAPLGPPHLAGHGGARPAPPPAASVGPWPRPSASSSTAAFRPRSGCSSGPWDWTVHHAHRHRGDGLRRRTVQQLRPAVDGGRWPGCSGPSPAPSAWSPR
jgi:hypothetical protein